MKQKKRKEIRVGDVIILCPEIAKEIGLKESLVLLQIYGWIQDTPDIVSFHNGRYWMRKSINDMWKEKFSFMGKRTLYKAIENLINNKYIIRGNYNKSIHDKTNWYAINYNAVKELKSVEIVKVSKRNT